MITAGDIQFEPPASKISFFTSSIAIMASGDSAFHTEIKQEVDKWVNERLAKEPTKWILVKDVAEQYVRSRNAARLNRAELAVLVPLGLDRVSWLTQQKIMDVNLVKEVARDLINFPIPDVSVIIAGLDESSGNPTPHIYTINNEYMSCEDVIGFSAIGSGARHAESQFMLAGHAWNAEISTTATLAYRAKKDAEVAPGVGSYTDMYMLGGGLGESTKVRDSIQEKMEDEYKKMKIKYVSIQAELNGEVKEYVASLPSADATTQANRPEITEAPSESGSHPEPPKQGGEGPV
jgi:hypothetical protein